MSGRKKLQQICLLPLTRFAINWAKQNSVKGQDYLVMKLVRRVGSEHIHVRAANGEEWTFASDEATWMPYETEEQRIERAINLTSNVIADWVQDRDPLLAEAIRQKQWQSKNGVAPSSKFLTIDPPKPKRRRKGFCPLSVPFGDGTQKCACHGVATASGATRCARTEKSNEDQTRKR